MSENQGTNRCVWVFCGDKGRFPGAIFTDRKKAEAWISENSLCGVLTKYLLDKPAYEWAIERSYFVPKKDHERSPNFIGSFTCAQMEHYHYGASD